MFSAENAEMSYACDQQAEINRLREVNAELVAALALLINDVQDYEAWQRPCFALDQARAALAKAKEKA